MDFKFLHWEVSKGEGGQNSVWYLTGQRCETSHLNLNTSKTKELISDFRHDPPPPISSRIRAEETEMVTEYKYLGLIIHHKLSWDQCANAIYKKGQQ